MSTFLIDTDKWTKEIQFYTVRFIKNILSNGFNWNSQKFNETNSPKRNWITLILLLNNVIYFIWILVINVYEYDILLFHSRVLEIDMSKTFKLNTNGKKL